MKENVFFCRINGTRRRRFILMLINFESKWKHANTFQKFNENKCKANGKILFQFLSARAKEILRKAKVIKLQVEGIVAPFLLWSVLAE